MRVYGIRVFVDDYEAARAFYTKSLGFPVIWEMADHGAIGLSAGPAQLIVESEAGDSAHFELVGRFTGVSLAVDDIDAAYAELRARGVPFIGPPERQFWGGMLAHFQDPAGNTLTLLGSAELGHA